jgi:Fe-S cluster biogenesis protein NfuA
MWERIRIVGERDRFVAESVVEELGPGAREVVDEVGKRAGFRWDERPLGEQVGDQPIHAFLQDKVDRVERSEVELVGSIERKFGEEGRRALERAFYRHGETFGGRLTDEAGVRIDDLEGIQEVLDTYVLEGMPCDGGATSEIGPDGRLVFHRPLSLHGYYWEQAGVSPGLMVGVVGKWIEGLIHGVSPGFSLERRIVGKMVEDRIGAGGEEKTYPEGTDDFVRRVNEALDQIRPMLAMDGGGIELVSADSDRKTVAVRLMGACHGCAGAQMTLQYGVEQALREKVPELEEMEVVA